MDHTSNLNFAERVVTVSICFLKPFHCGLGEPAWTAYRAKSQTKQSASISGKSESVPPVQQKSKQGGMKKVEPHGEKIRRREPR